MKEYHQLDEIQSDLKEQKISCLHLVEHYLQRIESHKDLNAFVEVYEQEAKDKAREIDKKLKANVAGRLAGLIFGIKDLLCYKGHPVTGSSNILKGFESQFTATAVQRLIDEDAIIIGHQNCDEFGMGSSNENSAHGPTQNPIDPTRVPGGSSGASAAAIGAGLCHISLGTDTGGSVRQPASFCGVVGIKPTYSRVSRWGLLAYASSFDTIGVIGKSVKDCALVLEIMSGKDPNDATSSSRFVSEYSKANQLNSSIKVAYYPDLLANENIQKEVKKAYSNLVQALKNQGHDLVEVEFPYQEHILPTYYILTTAEASTNLSRYDGAHYGHRSSTVDDLESMYKNSRSEGFGEEVKRRIMLGTFVLSADYYDAYFTQAQKVRRLIKEKTEKQLEEVDFIVTPTAPTTAFKQNSHNSPLEMYMSDLFTVQASISGIPAISIAYGKDDSDLPIGMQIMSGAFEEEKLFAFSKMLLDYNR